MHEKGGDLAVTAFPSIALAGRYDALVDLCDFLCKIYKHTPHYKLLGFMATARDTEPLGTLDQRNLAITYAEWMDSAFHAKASARIVAVMPSNYIPWALPRHLHNQHSRSPRTHQRSGRDRSRPDDALRLSVRTATSVTMRRVPPIPTRLGTP